MLFNIDGYDGNSGFSLLLKTPEGANLRYSVAHYVSDEAVHVGACPFHRVCEHVNSALIGYK